MKRRQPGWNEPADLFSVAQSFCTARWLKTTAACAIVLLALGSNADETLETIRVRGSVYTNVTVLSKSRSDVFIKFTGGMANIKVKDLDVEALSQLGYQVGPVKSKPSGPSVVAQKIQTDPRVQEMQAMITKQVETNLRQLDPRILWLVLGGAAFFYFFFCHCCVLICKKTGFEPGMLVWVPVLQAFPLLKAAGMPAWWFLWFLLPVLNLIASVVWCVKIAKARNKTFLTALMLMLPVTNFLAFVYLAFSDGGGGKGGDTRITFK